MSYAGADLEQPLQLDNEVKMATRRVIDLGIDFLVASDPQMEELQIKLHAAELHNKKLKSLSMYHLDLIMKQHDLMTKREKAFEALKHENARLRNKLNRMARKASFNQRQTLNPPPPVDEAPSSSTVKKEKFSPPMDGAPSSSAVKKENSPPMDGAPSSSAVKRENSPPMDGAASSSAVKKENSPPPMNAASSSSAVIKEEFSLPIDVAPSASAVVNEYSPPPMDVAYSLFAVVKEEADFTPKIYGL